MLNSSPMKKRQDVGLQKAPRPGEGAVMDTTVLRSAETSGLTATKFSFDLTRAPVPDRRYVSEVAAILADDQEVKVCFAQKRLGGGEVLRSALVVHIPFQGIGRFLKSQDNFLPSMQEFAERVQLPQVQLIDIKDEPAQTVALTANIIGASFSGWDACIDLYHTSAFAIWMLKDGGPLVVDPVVRVTLTTAQLLAITAGLQRMFERLPTFHREAEGL